MTRFALLCILFVGLLTSFWLMRDPGDKLVAAWATIIVAIFGIVNVGPIK